MNKIKYKGFFEQYYYFQFSNKKKCKKLISKIKIGTISENYRYIIDKKNLRKYSKNFDMNIQSLLKKVSDEMYLESQINDSKIEFGDGISKIESILFLMPISYEHKNQLDYIFPVLTIFKDGRGMIKFKTEFDEKIVDEKYNIDKILINATYTNMLTIYDNMCFVRGKKVNFYDLCSEYVKDFICCEKKAPITDYINIVIVDIENNEQNNRLLYGLSRAPIYDELISLDFLNEKIEFLGLDLFCTPKKFSASLSRPVFKSFSESLEMEDNYDKKLVSEFLLITSTYQIILETVNLRWYRMIFVLKNMNNNKKMYKKIKKIELTYMDLEKQILYAKYDSVINLYNSINSKIISSNKLKLYREIGETNHEYVKYTIDKNIANIANLIALISVILALISTYSPVNSILTTYNLDIYTNHVFLFLVLILFIFLYFFYKKK